MTETGIARIPIEGGKALSHTHNKGTWFKPEGIDVFAAPHLGHIAIHVITPRSVPICLSLSPVEAEGLANAILDTLREAGL